MKISFSFIENEKALPLKNSPGKAKSRIHLFDTQNAQKLDRYAVAAEKFTGIQKPKLNWLQKKLYILHLHTDEGGQTTWYKINKRSLQKRLNISTKELKKVLEASTKDLKKITDYTNPKEFETLILKKHSDLEGINTEEEKQKPKAEKTSPVAQEKKEGSGNVEFQIGDIEKPKFPHSIKSLEEGQSPLDLAVEQGNVKAAASLILDGGDVNALNRIGMSPLHIATQKGDIQMMKLLMQHKANINQQASLHCRLYNEYTPLHIAIRENKPLAVKYLLENKADHTIQSRYDSTPLHLAAKKASADIIEMLIANGANMEALDSENYTPLFDAAHYGRTEAIQVLLNHKANIKATNDSGDTPLHIAAMHGRNDAALLLINHEAPINAKNNAEDTPLHFAAQNARLSTLKSLINKSADINARNKRNQTALHAAVNIDVHQLSGDRIEIIRELIRKGINVNIRDLKGNTALDVIKKKKKHVRDETDAKKYDEIIDILKQT